MFSCHSRWRPDIPPVVDVTEGEVFRVEMVDCSGGSVGDNDSATDIKFGSLLGLSFGQGIPTKPGDLLAVEICNLGPLPGDKWDYTATFNRENGAIWYFEGIYAYSPHIPGVRFPGLTHLGVIGTAPSHELLNIWNEREKKLVEEGHQSLKLCEVLHQRPLASLPTAKNCLLGMIKEGSSEWEKIANEAARTIPGRENGGNCDIKNLSRGSIGDGEVSFCGAIEMSGFLELNIYVAIFDQDVRPRCERVPSGPRVVKITPDVLQGSYDGDLPITMNPGGGAESS
ncbi:Acetamidase/Formamidase protein [Dioscorea alata]|uniref:Acetamidase/Formamidase protein n=1 Tax=Dioscorea alata TaxID=55571 RepID=A0ACB7VHD6_DIOAL|nr:Acetamidase/Formamidase protein [Dioscorea alata]